MPHVTLPNGNKVRYNSEANDTCIHCGEHPFKEHYVPPSMTKEEREEWLRNISQIKRRMTLYAEKQMLAHAEPVSVLLQFTQDKEKAT